MADRNPLVIDLFCGAGGFSLGFHAAGCRILAAVDTDASAAQTFRRNFALLHPEHPPTVLGGDEGDIEFQEEFLLLGRVEGDLLDFDLFGCILGFGYILDIFQFHVGT